MYGVAMAVLSDALHSHQRLRLRLNLKKTALVRHQASEKSQRQLHCVPLEQLRLLLLQQPCLGYLSSSTAKH